MKTHTYLLTLLIASWFTLNLSAQKIPYKYGKVSASEFAEKADSSAVAEFLYKTGETDYRYDNGMFYIRSTYTMRIRILKEEGKRYADVAIPYYIFGQADIVLREQVEKLKAISYNLVDGKVEKTELDNRYVFDEEISEDVRRIKFSIPNVQVGSIIEYQYTIESNYPLYLRDLDIQEDVPVRFAKYELLIPEYFRFRPSGNGKGIQQQQTREIQTFHILTMNQTHQADVESFRYQYFGQDLPPLKEEPLIWCKDDYRTSIHFEFQKLDFPYNMPKEFAHSWGGIMGALKRHNYFGRFLRMKNPLKEETEQWLTEHSDLSIVEKARHLFHILKSHIQWDHTYRLFGEHPTKSLTEMKSGSNADINFIYMSMLQDAGISCAPILIRNRREGRMPLYYPSVNKISTFVVGFYDEEESLHCMDASTEKGDIDILPLALMPETAVLLDYNNEPPVSRFVNLSKLGAHYTTHLLNIDLSDEGIINGTYTGCYYGQDAQSRRELFKEETDSLICPDIAPHQDDITVTHYSIEDTPLSPKRSETIQFRYKPLSSGEYIYINPLLFLEQNDNPFKSPVREHPIELPYKKRLQVITTCKIPAHYAVEELPQPLSLRLSDNSIRLNYSIVQEGDEVKVNYSINISKTYFEAERYEELKSFVAGAIEAGQSQIVLKRKN